MNSSELPRLLLVQSLSLPGRFSRPVVALLRLTAALAAREASRARAARMMRADDRLGDGAVLVQPLLERRAHGVVDQRLGFGVVQPVLGLALELRIADEDAEHADQAFADVLGGERDAARREVVRVDVVAHRFADAGAQAVLVRAARAGGDAVDVAAQVLVGGFGPLKARPRRGFRRCRAPARTAASCTGLACVRCRIFFEVVERGPPRAGRCPSCWLTSSFEDDLHALVQVAGDFEALADEFGVELGLGEDGRIGMEVDGRAAAARLAQLLQLGRPACRRRTPSATRGRRA